MWMTRAWHGLNPTMGSGTISTPERVNGRNGRTSETVRSFLLEHRLKHREELSDVHDAVLVAVGDMEEVAIPSHRGFHLQGPHRRCEFAQIQGQAVLDVRRVKRCRPPLVISDSSALEDPTQGVPRGFQ